MQKISIGIAGSTAHTLLCAKAVHAHDSFEVAWVLTPEPKEIGRNHILTTNPLQAWAEDEVINVINISKKIDQNIKDKIEKAPVDILLVVDFGYLVPPWLLAFPHIGPVNIHPSQLPRWRGSSPGQFVLLFGETESAVTVMQMAAGMDTGPLITQLPLHVEVTWNVDTYYQVAFELVAKELPQILTHYAQHPTELTEQPSNSPTIPARRLSREDGFVHWELLVAAQNGKLPSAEALAETSELLRLVQQTTQQAWPAVICQAVAGLSPWPGLWSYAPMASGKKRVKILSTKITPKNTLGIETIQVEGENPKNYSAFLK